MKNSRDFVDKLVLVKRLISHDDLEPYWQHYVKTVCNGQSLSDVLNDIECENHCEAELYDFILHDCQIRIVKNENWSKL